MQKTIENILAVLFWVAVWWVLSEITGSELLLPDPRQTVLCFVQLASTGSFWSTVVITMLRILFGTLCAIAVGGVFAAVTCRWRFAGALFSPLLTVIRSTPVASFILLVLIWVGRNILPSVIVFLMVLPVVWQNTVTGIRNTDPQLSEMGSVFRFGCLTRLRRIYIPSVLPHFLAACRTALGLGWKAGVAAEVLAVPARSIGRMLYDSKLYMNTTELFAWTLTVILCSLFIEKLLAAAIGRLYIRGGGGNGAI